MCFDHCYWSFSECFFSSYALLKRRIYPYTDLALFLMSYCAKKTLTALFAIADTFGANITLGLCYYMFKNYVPWHWAFIKVHNIFVSC